MKLKDLINENLWNERKFGEPLPTLEDTIKHHQLKEKEDDGYVSIGFGRFKKKGQEDKDGADVYVKSDKGQYVKTKDQSSDDKESPKGDDSEKKEKPKKLSGKDFDRDLGSDDKPKSDKPEKGVDSEDLDTKDFQAAKQTFDKIKDIDMDEFESGPEGYDQMMDALESLKGTKLDNYKPLQDAIDDLKTNQDEDSAELVRYTLSSLKDKKDPYSGKYLGEPNHWRKYLGAGDDSHEPDDLSDFDPANENYNPTDKFLKESIDLLKRDFGQPLPTLKSVTEKHQKNVKEGPDDVRITKKELQMLIKIEGKFRERMFKIEQGFLRDPRPENRKLAKDIKKSYKDNVTKFMREVVGMLKRMK